jgi:hypothetical protein
VAETRNFYFDENLIRDGSEALLRKSMLVNQYDHLHYDPSLDNSQTVKLLQFMHGSAHLKQSGQEKSKKDLMEFRRRSSDIYGGN